jgi:hypothetical protein
MKNCSGVIYDGKRFRFYSDSREGFKRYMENVAVNPNREGLWSSEPDSTFNLKKSLEATLMLW